MARFLGKLQVHYEIQWEISTEAKCRSNTYNFPIGKAAGGNNGLLNCKTENRARTRF